MTVILRLIDLHPEPPLSRVEFDYFWDLMP